jgi:hypothetical protein
MSNLTARVQLVSDLCAMPDGTYTGLWSAYVIDVPLGPVTLRTESCSSLDGMPVTVTVTNGRATVEY